MILLTVQSKKQPWFEAVKAEYVAKLSRFCEFKIHCVREKELGREDQQTKVARTDNEILNFIGPRDYVIVFDETGKAPRSSIEFTKILTRALESGKPRILWVVGGAFGLGPRVRQRADHTVSLSTLTLSHQVAQVVVLEQLYRAWTIHKNLPYHNEGSVESRT